MLIHDLDFQLLLRARRSGTVRNWADRRTDLYRVEWTGGWKAPEGRKADPDAKPE